jgi:excisionase family DNA binding protein
MTGDARVCGYHLRSTSAPVKGEARACVMQCDRGAGAADCKLAYGIVEVSRATGLSRSTLYDLMKQGSLRFVKCGRRRLILNEDLVDFLQSLR